MQESALSEFSRRNGKRIEELASQFADYQSVQVTRARLDDWIGNFQAQHFDLALRLAGRISYAYYSTSRIRAALKELHRLVRQEREDLQLDPRAVLYVPVGKTGESGDLIARSYLAANRMHGQRDQFVRDIEVQAKIGEVEKKTGERNPMVVLLDDLIGTGDQILDYWPMLQQLVPAYLPMFLGTVAACPEGVQAIEEQTSIRILSVHPVGSTGRLTALPDKRFSKGDKHTVERYCRNIGNLPMGFGELGLLISFAHGTPTNTISVIRGSEGQEAWIGLLPRDEDLP